MEATDTLYKKYQDLFDFSKDTVEKGLDIVAGQNAENTDKQVILFHFVRASYLLEAINKLCLEGFATEAMVILRSLLNLYINIKWLTSGDSKQRFERFCDFEAVSKKLAIDNAIKFGQIDEEFKDDDFTVHDDDFKRVKEKYNLKSLRDFYNWSGKSIYQMAKDADLENEYKIIYGRLSSIEHTGPYSVREYLDDSENGKTIIRKGARDKNVDLVILTALGYYFKVKVILHNAFDIDWPDSEVVEQQFEALRKTYWGN